MSRYLLMASRSPWESAAGNEPYRLARDLAAAGHEVTLFLVQNGVLAARAGAHDAGLESVGAATVLADDFSLRERAIPSGGLRPGIRAAAIDVAADQIARGARAIWM